MQSFSFVACMSFCCAMLLLTSCNGANETASETDIPQGEQFAEYKFSSDIPDWLVGKWRYSRKASLDYAKNSTLTQSDIKFVDDKSKYWILNFQITESGDYISTSDKDVPPFRITIGKDNATMVEVKIDTGSTGSFVNEFGKISPGLIAERLPIPGDRDYFRVFERLVDGK